MSKARDIADLDFNAPDIDGGNIDGAVIGGTTAAAVSGTTGQFATSLNVDGTATVDGLTVDGTALLGLSSPITNPSSTTDGVTFGGSYTWTHVSDAGGQYVQRQNDGTIFSFYGGTTNVGSIGTKTGSIYMGTGDAGIGFNHHGGGNLDSIMPYSITAGAFQNGAVDIGGSSNKFKDLHLSGIANVPQLNLVNSAATQSLNVSRASGGAVTNGATIVSGAVAKFNGNVTGSDSLRIGSFDNSTGAYYIDVSNYNGTGAYDLSLNPYVGNVGIGIASPNRTQHGSINPKLHVKAAGTVGAYDLVARFEAGNDSSATGASILINHENDRGLLIEAGRANGGDIGVAHFGVTNSGGTNTRAITILATGSTSNVVLMPGQPAFDAYHSGGSYASGTTVTSLDLNSVRLNRGNHYSASNDRFIAPVAGVYVFYYRTIISGTYTNLHVRFRKNNAVIPGGDTHASPGNANWSQISSQILVQLAVNDYVQVEHTTSTNIYGDSYQTFQGHLLG